MQTVDLPLTHLFPRRDARPLDDTSVRHLVESIKEVGIINPIRVRPARRFVDGVEADCWEITAGKHRWTAAKRIGLETVPAIVVEDDDLHAELAMIDENLMRAELGAADRAAQTARRKAIYLELHPETAQHVSGAHAANRAMGNAADNLSVASFASATAEAIGRDERTVRRDAERGESISGQALKLVRDSHLDTGVYLDKLKKVDPEKQVEKVRQDLEKAEERKALEKRNANANRVVEISDAERFAEWLFDRADASELDTLISWLQGTKPKDVIAALRREAA